MKAIASTLLLFCVFILKAQDDYIITTQNDTIYGEVTLPLPSTHDEPMRIKTDDGTQQYSASQIRVSRMEGDIYKPIRLGTKYRMMKEVLPGYLGLYEFRPDESYQFGSRYLHKITNEGTEISALFFRNSMAKFLSECETITEGLENKKYSLRNIEELVMDYNRICIDSPGQEEKIVPKASNADHSLEELKELSTLLSDIIQKLENGDPVPGYLKAALKAYADKDTDSMITSLLEQLEE